VRKLEPREALAVRWAERAATDHTKVDAAFGAELREHFSNAEVVELGMMIGQYLAFGRLLVMLDLHKGACELYVPDA
jgi:alkylhydroperoxidase family enzyme